MPQVAVKHFWLDDADWSSGAKYPLGASIGARFWRNNSGHLVLERASRRVRPGLYAYQGDEVASEHFGLEWTDWETVQTDMSAVWTTNKTDPIATLKAAVDAHLQALGYRKPNGDDIT